jgi:hypothetical protein
LLEGIGGVQEHEMVDAVYLRSRHAPEDSTNHALRVRVLLSWHKLEAFIFEVSKIELETE